jgi:putative transposase
MVVQAGWIQVIRARPIPRASLVERFGIGNQVPHAQPALAGFPTRQAHHSWWVVRAPFPTVEEASTMGQVFHQLYYHIVWTTKNRGPLLTEPLRPLVLASIRQRCERLGCTVHAVNAVEDHVHVAVEIPPSRAVSAVVGQMKGASSHEVNQLGSESIKWQDGYGVLTFRQAELEKVKRYIATQEERHRAGAVSALLETWKGPGADPDGSSDEKAEQEHEQVQEGLASNHTTLPPRCLP